MITYDEALAKISSLTTVDLGSSRLPLLEALGHQLSDSVVAPFASPGFTNSAMDGYAFKHQDLSAHSSLRSIQGVYAGDDPSAVMTYQPGCCIKIMTGAPLPPWADTVVPVERTQLAGDVVQLTADLDRGANIRHQGEDIAAGSVLMAAGTRLEPEQLMVLANFGFEQVRVRNKPKVGLLSTGDELIDLGQTLEPGKIYNSSKYFLAASLKRWYGIEAVGMATLPDDPKLSAPMVLQLLEQDRPNLIITTGAVSAGDKDFIPNLALELGFDPLFHKIAVRPGKPVFCGVKDQGQIWIGLPGNPISTATSWHFVVRPLLRHWAGLPLLGRIKANVISDIQKPEGLTCFFRAQYKDNQVKALPNQGSAHFLASVDANAYIVLSRAFSMIKSGTSVDVQII